MAPAAIILLGEIKVPDLGLVYLCPPFKLDFNLVELSGSFGRVMLAKQKKSGDFYAMKRLKKADIIKLRQVDHVISENTILADIDHPFLVSARTH